MLNETSIDPKEVAHYQRLAQTWWDTSGPFWPLHRLNTLRVAYLRKILSRHFARDDNQPRPLSGLRVLDVGCGGGILSEAMAKLGADVTGVDVVERSIVIARQHAEQMGLNLQYRAISAEALVNEGAQFDIVLNMEVVEHVADLPGFMHACSRLVAADGVMAVATLNRTWLSWLFAIIGAEYILRWLPRGTHQWRRFPTPRELTHMLNHDGLAITAQTGVRVNPFTRSFHLTSIMSINYMLIAARAA